MTCTTPLNGWEKKQALGGGITWKKQESNGNPMSVPCGQCHSCRRARRRTWALRCKHEAELYDQNCMVTLTYANEHLPPDFSVKKTRMQKFMKDLRANIAPYRVRFLGCGEYGDRRGRPHYHILLFGWDFMDKEIHSRTKAGTVNYRSERLEKIWRDGHATVNEFSFECAEYVAGYIQKKLNGPLVDEVDEVTGLKPYEWANPVTGEIHQREPEFMLASRRPGIGREWFERFQDDLYPHGYAVNGDYKMQVPAYYEKLMERESPELIAKIKRDRRSLAKRKKKTPEELERLHQYYRALAHNQNQRDTFK